MAGAVKGFMVVVFSRGCYCLEWSGFKMWDVVFHVSIMSNGASTKRLMNGFRIKEVLF